MIIYDVFRNLWISFWNIPQALWSTKMGLDSGCAFLLQGIVLKSEWNCAEWLLLIFLMVEHRPEGPALNNVLWNICFGVLRIKKHCQWVLEQLPLLNQVFSLRPSRWLKPSWSEARVVFFDQVPRNAILNRRGATKYRCWLILRLHEMFLSFDWTFWPRGKIIWARRTELSSLEPIPALANYPAI